MHKLPIIIDTDPGQDDAVAILMALASPELDVLGIVTVGGNVPLAANAGSGDVAVDATGKADAVVGPFVAL